MFNNILNLEGVTVLDKKQQGDVIGGDRIVYCRFSDGGNWYGQTDDAQAFEDMQSHCTSSGGQVFISPEF